MYDTFLSEFPLCYGYWKKYADHEGRLGSHESVIAVYERAVQAVTYSVDMWTHYCSYVISKQEDSNDVRRYTWQILFVFAVTWFLHSLIGRHEIVFWLPFWKWFQNPCILFGMLAILSNIWLVLLQLLVLPLAIRRDGLAYLVALEQLFFSY